jgi:L-iditol 2-dehydrogenase
MKAVLKLNPGVGVEVREVDEPHIASSEVLVKVRAAAICGSDIPTYTGVRKVQLPLIMGHEFSGDAIKVGEDVKHIKEGDKVSAHAFVYCGQCFWCKLGRTNLCEGSPMSGTLSKVKIIGVYGIDGAFADYVAVPAANIVKLPGQMSYEKGALFEPLAVCVHAVRMSGVEIGDTVAVVGAGPLGLLMLQVAKATGAGLTILTDAIDDRLARAKTLGADETINIEKHDATERIMDITDGAGVDRVIEVTGKPLSVAQAINIARTAGSVTLAGSHFATAEIDPNKIMRYELTIHGSITYVQEDFPRAITLLDKVEVEPIITHRLPLDDAEGAFKLLLSKEAVKVLFIPR